VTNYTENYSLHFRNCSFTPQNDVNITNKGGELQLAQLHLNAVRGRASIMYIIRKDLTCFMVVKIIPRNMEVTKKVPMFVTTLKTTYEQYHKLFS